MKKRVLIFSIISVVIVLICMFFLLLTWSSNVIVVKITDTSEITDKIKNVMKGNGSIDITEADFNAILNMNSKNINKNIKEIYAKIMNNKLHMFMKVNYKGINFFTESTIVPKYDKSNIYLTLETLKIGKIKSPDFLTEKILKVLKSQGLNINGKIIKMSNKVLFFEVSSLKFDNNILKLTLKTEPIAPKTQSGGNNIASGSASSKDQKVSLLKNTNSQLYRVRDAVQSQQAKNWVSNVISINAKMISNPDGNYSSEMNAAKGSYNSMPQSDRNDIKTAALFNMDTSAVRFLASSYGLMN